MLAHGGRQLQDDAFRIRRYKMLLRPSDKHGFCCHRLIKSLNRQTVGGTVFRQTVGGTVFRQIVWRHSEMCGVIGPTL